MTPERWKQIESLVEAALEVDTDVRSDFLDAACGEDPELRRAVEALLASLDQVDSFMERPAFRGFTPTHSTADLAKTPAQPSSIRRSEEPAEGDRVGHYRILHEIGRGGMGTVYAAARDDQAYEHRVAIKLVRPGMDTDSVAQRFRSERQILANLDHPNIARLLDGGTADDGRPYFVMELIEGIRIDRYCDRKRLFIRQRLEIFREVCAAVDFAHRNLVVHRDIKPSNILVTEGGVPKLLDFGIAKLLEPADFPYTVEATRTGLRPMTPPYASPEQILGQAITTASDVYSLGVLLYKLLTGRLPYAMEGPSPQEMQRALLDQVAKPSIAITRRTEADQLTPETISHQRGTQPQQLRRHLAGDLDNIVLMALRREPERRYGSTEQLAEDLRRHLGGLPVSARRDTFGYRAGKFLRRNKVAAGIAGTSVALVLGFASSMARQRDRARKERDKSDKISTFLTDLFDLTDPDEAVGSSVTAREILSSGVDKIHQELEDQPELQASLMSTIGRIYRKLGLYEHAEPLLKQALSTKETLLGEDHLEVAEVLNELALLQTHRGLYDQAAGMFQRALDIRSDLLGSDHPATTEIMINLAGNHVGSCDRETATKLIESGLRTLDRGSSPSPLLLARTLNIYAFCCLEEGKCNRAEKLQRRALELLDESPQHNQLELATGITNLGTIYLEKYDYRRAEQSHRRALSLFQDALGKKHHHVAVCISNIAICHSARGRYSSASKLFRDALEIAKKVAWQGRRTEAIILNNMAIMYRREGDFERAESLFGQASSAYESSDSAPGIYVAYNLCHQAQLHRDRAQFDRAEPLYQRAVQIQEQVLGASHIDLAESLSGLAYLYTRQGRHDDAKTLYDQSLAVAERATSKYPESLRVQAQLAVVHLGLGDWHSSVGQEKQAARAWNGTLAIIEAITSTSVAVEHLDTHCGALLRLDRIDEAKPIVDRLLAIGWCTPDFLDLCRQHDLIPELDDSV